MVTVNGQTYEGNNVSVRNNEVWVDGKKVGTENHKQISIVVQGDGAKVEVDSCDSVRIEGNAQGIITTNGNINVVGSVMGNVNTVNGNVSCSSIGGHVTTVNGDIKPPHVR